MASNFNDTTPAAPAGGVNVKWQTDGNGNDSAYLPLGSVSGGVLAKTSTYAVASADATKLITFSSASALSLTLLASAPANGWFVDVENTGAGALTVNPNGANLDGAAGSLILQQNQGVRVFSDGTNYFTERGVGSSAGVNVQTSSYLLVASDQGKDVVANSASALTLTLPATPPSSGWVVDIENINTGTVTISRNGLTIDGAASNLTLTQNMGVRIFTDGTNYFTQRGMGASAGGTPWNAALGNTGWFRINTSAGGLTKVWNASTTGQENVSAAGTVFTSFQGATANGTAACTVQHNAAANSPAGFFGSNGGNTLWDFTNAQLPLRFESIVAIERITDAKFYCGLFPRLSVGTGFAGTTLVAASYGAYFRFDTTASDTKWTACTSDGTTLVTVATSLAADTNTHKFAIVSTTTSVLFYIDEALVATITTHLPSASVTPWAEWQVSVAWASSSVNLDMTQVVISQ